MITPLIAAAVSERARAFLAAVSVAPDVLGLRPDYRVLVTVAEGLEPGLPGELSAELLARAEIRARITLDAPGHPNPNAGHAFQHLVRDLDAGDGAVPGLDVRPHPPPGRVHRHTYRPRPGALSMDAAQASSVNSQG